MNHPLEENTISDMSHAIFGKAGHSKLAKSFVEFINEEAASSSQAPIEITSIKRFVLYLINKKGYN